MKTEERKIVIIGWGAHSEPLHRFQDELKLPSYMRTYPTKEQIEVQKGPLKVCGVCNKIHVS